MSAPRVLLCVTGGIAAYKACEVLRGLQKAGCDVRVAMSQAATQFVGIPTFRALSNHEVATDLFDDPTTPIPHIELAQWAEIAVVAPATANIMAKIACGIADDLVSSTLLAFSGALVVAPGMNTRMWEASATRHNTQVLRERGVHIVEPASGRLACGDVGAGKLADPDAIVASVLGLLNSTDAATTQGLLAGRTVVITAGPTHEAIDPVRFIGNASTGKMGFALAAEAARQGAHVHLIAGPVCLPTPEGVTRTDVVSAADMLAATTEAFINADAAICTAAVADYTPAHPADHKLKKSQEPLNTLELVQTEDILATLCATKGNRVVVGFAAETNDLLANAKDKLARKGADLIVANDVSRADSTFGANTSRIALVESSGVTEHPTYPLPQVASLICARLAELLNEKNRG